MFSFFKKNKQKVKEPNTEIKASLTSEQIVEIEQSIQQLQQQIANSNDAKLLAVLNEKTGILYHQLERIDLAIEYLEISLQHKKSIGEGYKILMNLYNLKRAEAATNGSMADIDFWMNKMNSMRNIAKQVTILRD
ncbi:tetratricopeptide repeat protein [Gilliamella apicola]|uniref:tetratricopeptide repeat protein n=1 Tax=Gilliamella apicola TaxID=1196095 RepID=UPI003987C483